MSDEGLHSRIGPSSFHRAEACTASVLGVETLPEPMPSEYALMGTLAHKVLEHCLYEGQEPADCIGMTHTERGVMVSMDEELAEVVSVAMDWVRANVGPGESVEAERKLVLPGSKRMFGTCDLLVVPLDIAVPLKVADLKSGWLDVGADSVQVGLYGLMALYDTGRAALLGSDPDRVLVETTIIQPRRAGNKGWQWTAKALAELELRVARLEAKLDRGLVEYHAGGWCRYCKRLPSCDKLRQATQDVVAAEISGLAAPEMDRIGALMPALKLFITAFENAALNYLQEGGTLTSLKLVEKRPTRVWKDATEAEAWLGEVLTDPYAPRTILTPAAAEKALGRKRASEVNARTTKISAGLTIAQADDPRPEVRRDEAQRARVKQQMELLKLKKEGTEQ
jgi:hypothetical protein